MKSAARCTQRSLISHEVVINASMSIVYILEWLILYVECIFGRKNTRADSHRIVFNAELITWILFILLIAGGITRNSLPTFFFFIHVQFDNFKSAFFNMLYDVVCISCTLIFHSWKFVFFIIVLSDWKLNISIYGFGGQLEFKFNILQHVFITKYGTYTIAFNRIPLAQKSLKELQRSLERIEH